MFRRKQKTKIVTINDAEQTEIQTSFPPALDPHVVIAEKMAIIQRLEAELVEGRRQTEVYRRKC